MSQLKKNVEMFGVLRAENMLEKLVLLGPKLRCSYE